jgi:hypothetical protein
MYVEPSPHMKRRALEQVRTAGRDGLLVDIGWESRTQMHLVADGLLWQSVARGGKYKFELTPLGRRALEQN